MNKHAGDCTIYRSMINERPCDGVCTCGYGWSLVRKGDWSQMYSEERQQDIERIERLRNEIAQAKEIILTGVTRPDGFNRNVGPWKCPICGLFSGMNWQGWSEEAPRCCGGEPMVPYRIPPRGLDENGMARIYDSLADDSPHAQSGRVFKQSLTP